MTEHFVEERLMGCSFRLGIVSDDISFAKYQLDKGVREIRKMESELSEFIPGSDVSRINRYAARCPVVVSQACFELLQRSLQISGLTHGDFDITVAPLKKLYCFRNAGFQMPPEDAIREAMEHVGYNKLELDSKNYSVRFADNGMQISFAAIGKGYASDVVKKMWQRNGVVSGYINASGDLNAFGYNLQGEVWNVGIAHPDSPEEILMHLPLQDASMATSGDYEQHFMFNDQRYSHNIHPHTGYPLCGIKSVSIISPAAELSDALATAVYVKGVKSGIAFVNQLPHTHAIIITADNQVFFSKHLNYENRVA